MSSRIDEPRRNSLGIYPSIELHSAYVQRWQRPVQDAFMDRWLMGTEGNATCVASICYRRKVIHRMKYPPTQTTELSDASLLLLLTAVNVENTFNGPTISQVGGVTVLMYAIALKSSDSLCYYAFQHSQPSRATIQCITRVVKALRREENVHGYLSAQIALPTDARVGMARDLHQLLMFVCEEGRTWTTINRDVRVSLLPLSMEATTGGAARAGGYAEVMLAHIVDTTSDALLERARRQVEHDIQHVVGHASLPSMRDILARVDKTFPRTLRDWDVCVLDAVQQLMETFDELESRIIALRVVEALRDVRVLKVYLPYIAFHPVKLVPMQNLIGHFDCCIFGVRCSLCTTGQVPVLSSSRNVPQHIPEPNFGTDWLLTNADDVVLRLHALHKSVVLDECCESSMEASESEGDQSIVMGRAILHLLVVYCATRQKMSFEALVLNVTRMLRFMDNTSDVLHKSQHSRTSMQGDMSPPQLSFTKGLKNGSEKDKEKDRFLDSFALRYVVEQNRISFLRSNDAVAKLVHVILWAFVELFSQEVDTSPQ